SIPSRQGTNKMIVISDDLNGRFPIGMPGTGQTDSYPKQTDARRTRRSASWRWDDFGTNRQNFCAGDKLPTLNINKAIGIVNVHTRRHAWSAGDWADRPVSGN